MLSKKTKKSKQNKRAKKGYDLNKIETKKATKKPSKQRGVLNLFFSLVGFVVVVGGVLSIFIPTLAQAKGIHIVEPFSCEVALADYHHLTKTTKENNPQFKQEQLERALEAVTQELKLHGECGGVRDEN